ncbi:MAG TPA: hypothetical protein PKC48_02155 [Sphingorhabdus sp.]|jgi:hypothetical protein|uniref:hypothetical protein n=1 Tax=Sphingorhabdus sp. TaxID=1902408 RepID=UPI002CBE8CF7|nr:hypothetical protein [Sphingorhabdus sp.]MBK7162537.1 hypothetical protein [Sphingomonadales bacterium]HMT41275.1 hypothetical protein [Sphingorhabdus sp.]HMU21058.1 hypothetical protein [Sphingorhabdus sp.]
MDPDKLAIISAIGPMIGVGIVSISAGWVITTWLRIKNGYPLDGAWGQAVYPKTDQESVERIKLLSQENAQLRAELGSIKDRLASVEKIVVDDTHKLTAEIEALRGPAN